MARVTTFYTKQDMSRFTREHVHKPVTWTTEVGPGGTIVVIERDADIA